MKTRTPRTQKLRFETLEDRRMLSVNWIVNTNSDVSTWSTTDDILSLREAVACAGNGDIITFDPSLSGKTVSIKYGEIAVDTQIEIDASALVTLTGNNKITIDALSRSRHFTVSEGASLTMKSINLTNGFKNGDGGSIYTFSTLVLRHCNITSSAASGYGGGIFSYKGDVTVTDGNITGCTGKEHGGGIYTYYGTLNLDGCSISNNTAGAGGGIDCNETISTIHNTKITDNKLNNSDLFAGGIFVLYGSMTITDSLISGNSSYNWGGGIYIYAANVSITNSAVTGNSTLNTGAGIQNFGYLTLTQCTIAGNITTADYSVGAGIYNEYDNGHGMYIKAYNCIIAGNISGDGESDYSGVGYGYAYTVLSTNSSAWTSHNNFFIYDEREPLFIDPYEKNFGLALNSQAIDLGNPSFAVYPDGSPIKYDLNGNDRYLNGTLDLGAYQYVPKQQLPSPTGLKVESAGANRLTVSWNTVSNSTGYIIDWSTDQINWKQGLTVNTSMTINSLVYEQIYYFKVMALGDNELYYDSNYSNIVSHRVSPVDIDSDGFIGPGDNAILSKAWFTMKGDDDWDSRCDIDGDGFVGPGDRSYLSINWFLMPGTDEITNPPQLAEAVESVLFEDLEIDLDDFIPVIL